jgi:hypothetical protein
MIAAVLTISVRIVLIANLVKLNYHLEDDLKTVQVLTRLRVYITNIHKENKRW